VSSAELWPLTSSEGVIVIVMTTSITRNLAVALSLTQALLHRQSLMMTNLLVIVIMKSTSKRP
jgi:hypothetical protein